MLNVTSKEEGRPLQVVKELLAPRDMHPKEVVPETQFIIVEKTTIVNEWSSRLVVVESLNTKRNMVS